MRSAIYTSCPNSKSGATINFLLFPFSALKRVKLFFLAFEGMRIFIVTAIMVSVPHARAGYVLDERMW